MNVYQDVYCHVLFIRFKNWNTIPNKHVLSTYCRPVAVLSVLQALSHFIFSNRFYHCLHLYK